MTATADTMKITRKYPSTISKSSNQNNKVASSPTNVMMAEATSEPQAILHIFITELPDRNQDLSIQLYTEFQLFNKLPKELRFMIWRFSLPKGRRVWLKIGKANLLKPMRAAPVATKVNRESRGEALKTYSRLHHTFPSYSALFVPVYTFWDDTHDTLLMDTINLAMSGTYLESLIFLLPAFWTNKTKDLRHVQNLEIKDLLISPRLFDSFMANDKKNGSFVLERIHDLKTIHLSKRTKQPKLPVAVESKMSKACIKWFTEIFQKKQKEDPSIRIPSIYIS